MDIVKVDPGPEIGASEVIFVFCALIAILLIWRTFRKPDTPTWGRHRKRDE